jgi:hypothetical protein
MDLAVLERAAGVGTKSLSTEVCGGREWVMFEFTMYSLELEIKLKEK